jgi:hypothetical protein
MGNLNGSGHIMFLDVDIQLLSELSYDRLQFPVDN